MAKGRIPLFMLCLALATGCTTTSQLEAGMDTFIGEAADSVIEVLGLPHADEQIAGKRVLSWSVIPSRSFSHDYHGYYRYYGGSLRGTGYQNYGCNLRVILDKNDVVESWDHQGSLGSCGKYRQILQERGEG